LELNDFNSQPDPIHSTKMIGSATKFYRLDRLQGFPKGWTKQELGYLLHRDAAGLEMRGEDVFNWRFENLIAYSFALAF